jgi:acyl-[acyl-carrier-protein]-phospholipid O-acyltransferase/long-chain-fatty-acid--[acyl-carrier-protein] ligase
MPSAWWLLALAPAYVALAWAVPAAIRPLFWLLARVLYRFRVYHADRLPTSGPALLVPNHVTYLDWMLLWAASPRRLTFVIWSGFDANPVLRVGLSFARHRLIRIDNTRPRAAVAALNAATAALDRGEAVVVFAEQTLTRNGSMLPFARGIEWVARRAAAPVPIVPVYLDNLWGTLLSWERGRVFWKWPRGPVRRPVAVYFGEPLPPTATAVEVRAAVQEGNARCGIRESDRLTPPPAQFVRMACRFSQLRRTAFIDNSTGSERKLSFARAAVGVWTLMGWLAPRLGPAPRVGLWLPTGMGSTLANLAVTALGKATVNLNYTAGPSPVASAVSQAGLTHVISAKRFLGKVPLEVPAGVTVLHLEDALAAASAGGKLLRLLAVLLLPGWVVARLMGIRCELDDPLTVLFSSGSTGEPKGVVLTHRNIAANVDSLSRHIDLRAGDIMLSALPVFHVFGHTVGMWAPPLVGFAAVFHPDPRQAKEVGELCRRYGCTIVMGTATFLRLYLRRCEPADYRTVRILPCGAEKLPVSVAEEFRKKFGLLPLEGYGTTELSPVVGVNLPDVTVGGWTQKGNSPGTIGPPIPGVCVRTFDPDTRRMLPVGAEGVLGVLGANVMAGYLDRPDTTAAVLVDGWYLTGDIGRVEPDGFVRITGRLSRFAKIAGEMVPLERLDDELHELLQADGERLLAVAAVACDRRGERVVVLHRPGVRDRLPAAFDGLRKRGLPNLWVPDPRDCYEVADFPSLSTGKLDLRGLADLAKAVSAG